MALIFSTRRQQRLSEASSMAKRLAQPLSTGEVLGPDGVNDVRALARADVANRNTQAIGDALRHRLGLPQTTIAQLEAGLTGTSVVDPIKNPADPRLIAKFGAELCLKHRVLPWRSVAGASRFSRPQHTTFYACVTRSQCYSARFIWQS